MKETVYREDVIRALYKTKERGLYQIADREAILSIFVKDTVDEINQIQAVRQDEKHTCKYCTYCHSDRAGNIGCFHTSRYGTSEAEVEPDDCCSNWRARNATNEDVIHEMNIEELAEFITDQRFAVIKMVADVFGIDISAEHGKCKETMLQWLKQEI